MKHLLIILAFLLTPFVSWGQQITRESLIEELSDVGTLLAADAVGCGYINEENVKWFINVFNAFMLEEGKDHDIGEEDIKQYQIQIFETTYVNVVNRYETDGCYTINKIISNYGKARVAPSPYFYYTPLIEV